MARWWLSMQCTAIPNTSGQAETRQLTLKGRCACHSHPMTWSRKEQSHFCCGGQAKEHISEKLAEECKPPAEKTRAHYVVRARKKSTRSANTHVSYESQ
ncbi:unnamed protein product, partial [Prorocentrum cordatum]